MMRRTLQILVGSLLILVYADHSLVQARTLSIPAYFNETYTSSVSTSMGYTFDYNYIKKDEGSVIRVTTSMPQNSTSTKYPIQIITYEQLAVESWMLPRELSDRNGSFHSFTKTLCSKGQSSNISLPFSVVAKTFSPSPIPFELKAELVNITVSHNVPHTTFITPTSPSYYQYTFRDSRDKPLLLNVISSNDQICALVSLQDADCPVEDFRENDVTKGVVFQTFLKKAAITINKNVLPSSTSIFIVFTDLSTSTACNRTLDPSTVSVSSEKEITFHIEDSDKDIDYPSVIGFTIGYCGFFYVCVAAYLIYRRFRERETPNTSRESPNTSGATSDIRTALSTPRQEDEASEPSENVLPVADHADHSADGTNHSADNDSVRPVEPADPNQQDIENPNKQLIEVITSEPENYKRVYRFQKPLMLPDMSRKSNSTLRKKYSLYVWITVIVALFYATPAVQIVLSFQYFMNHFGDQDSCYYNFLCSKGLGPFHSFNNIISNIGYVSLGILFIIFVGFRHSRYNKLTEEAKGRGIPQFYGLFYAMGMALIVEGFMSSFYHVCPRYNIFQFDTAFMLILGVLLMVRLYQARHPDVDTRAALVYLLLALLIAIVAIGVLAKSHSTVVWIVFTILHVLFLAYFSLNLYYVGSYEVFTCKQDRSLIVGKLIRHIKQNGCRCVAPLHQTRLVLIAFLVAVNIAIFGYGLAELRDSFASYVLYLIIGNMGSYFLKYLAAKCWYREEWTKTFVAIVVTLLVVMVTLWGLALYFFTRNITEWKDTPAESRNLNESCYWFNYYDKHDVWHFLSAAAMFISFMVILIADDNLSNVQRRDIYVF